MLSWNEVFQGLKMGKKYNRKGWDSGNDYIQADEYNDIRWYFTVRVNTKGDFKWSPMIEDFEALDWIEVVDIK